MAAQAAQTLRATEERGGSGKGGGRGGGGAVGGGKGEGGGGGGGAALLGRDHRGECSGDGKGAGGGRRGSVSGGSRPRAAVGACFVKEELRLAHDGRLAAQAAAAAAEAAAAAAVVERSGGGNGEAEAAMKQAQEALLEQMRMQREEAEKNRLAAADEAQALRKQLEAAETARRSAVQDLDRRTSELHDSLSRPPPNTPQTDRTLPPAAPSPARALDSLTVAIPTCAPKWRGPLELLRCGAGGGCPMDGAQALLGLQADAPRAAALERPRRAAHLASCRCRQGTIGRRRTRRLQRGERRSSRATWPHWSASRRSGRARSCTDSWSSG